MNIPAWFGEWLSRPVPIEPQDPHPQPLGTLTEVAPELAGLSASFERARMRVGFLSDEIIEVRIGGGGDLDLPSFARAEPASVDPPGPIAFVEAESGWSVASAAARVEISRSPGRLTVRTPGGEVVVADDPALGMARTTGGWRAHWTIGAGDRVFGLGAKTGGMNRRGRRTALWARDMVVGARSDPLYASIPFFLLARGGRWLGVLLDSAARSVFDFGCGSPHVLGFGPADGALAYVLFTGPTLRDVLSQYAALTGLPPLPPRWALGHHQSRYSYHDAAEVREIAAEFRRRDIPTDVIHLDIHYMAGFRVFTFHPTRFDDPQRLTADLAADGFRIVTIVDPGVKVDRRYSVFREGVERGYFARGPAGAPFVMKVWPGNAVFPDFFRPEVRQWWGEWHRVYTGAGVAGIWNDMNEPSGWGTTWYLEDGVVPLGQKNPSGMTHDVGGRAVPHAAVRNAYGHLENMATHEGLRRLQPDRRPFVLTRSSFAGTQRYAAQWTGDVLSSWSSLRQSVPMMLGLGLSGMSFTGTDIGGFFGNCSPELYARWAQIGALAPFCRTHTALHTRRQEPWSFGPEVEAIARAALKLRYRLLPYLYTCFWEASRTGMPVWRPLCAEFPGDERLFDVDDEVMVGPALLAAPVLEQGATRRRVVLPAGRWYAWDTGVALDGGGVVDVDAPLDRMPLFVRGGAAVPTQGDVRHTGDRPEGPVLWRIFWSAGARGDIGAFYEDDGVSLAHREGEWCVTPVGVAALDGVVSVRIGPTRGGYRSLRREAQVQLYGVAPRTLRADGAPVADGAAIRFPHGALHTIELEIGGAGAPASPA